MTNLITCPNCKQEIKITEVLKREFEEEFSLELKKVGTQAEEERKRRQKTEEELLELTKQMRRINQEKDQMRLEMEKKLAADEEKIREESRKKALEETALKMLEKDKKITDMEKMMEELKKTARQGSQQTQGEVLELELEQALRREFPNDVISDVPKGVRGADIIQDVRDRGGKSCGTIIWESKNAKWNANWMAKLKDDQRAINASMAVLLTVDLPEEYRPFSFQNQIYITGRENAVAVAKLLRLALYEVFKVKLAGTDKQDKKEYLYEYINSREFLSKMESLIETFSVMNEEVEKEKRWFAAKWARQEKQLRKALDSAHSFYGDVQGITGNTLPEMKSLGTGD